ncbi:hypothetical protein PENSPDRAFT_689827 [Peniophora sp. CONT]|nr:hypothetical protein PENSPDRAFT_689827 [Peniophora sp. CONT]
MQFLQHAAQRRPYVPKLPASVVTSLRKECMATADSLAQKVQLLEGQARDVEVDLSEDEMSAFIELKAHILSLPDHTRESVILAFSAKYLPALAHALCTSSIDTQRRAATAYINIFLMLGTPFPPKPCNPYLRRLLMSVASALLNDIGTENIREACKLVYVVIVLGDKSRGDDGRACIDQALRSELKNKLEPLKLASGPIVSRSDENQGFQIGHLADTLGIIDDERIASAPMDYLAVVRRGALEVGVSSDENAWCEVCSADSELKCSRCKATWYCGTTCQSRAWKEEHKLRCFDCTF